MKRRALIILFAIVLIVLSVTCFTACEPTQTKDINLLYAEIKDSLKNFGTLFESSNGYTYAMQMTYANSEGEAYIKKTHSPVYLEYSSTDIVGDDLQALIREENGKVVAYTKELNNRYKKTLLGDPDSYEQPTDICPNVSVWDDITLNTDNCSINYNKGTYRIVSNYKDVELGDLKSAFDYLFDQDEKEALNNCVVAINITVTESKAVISLKTTLDIGTDDNPDKKSLKITQTVDLSEFEKIDFDNGNYRIIQATSIEEARELTDISKPLICDENENVFKVELEQGLYCIKYERKPHVTIRSADNLKDILNLGIFDTYVSNLNDDYNYCFNVEKPGQYYITFSYCNDETYEIVRCNYNDFYDINNPKTLKENTKGTLEGKYDLEYYSYTNEKEGLVTITNTSNTAIDIICKLPVPIYPYWQLTLGAGESLKNIPIIGEVTLFVCKPDATQPVKYSLTASFYHNDNGISKDFDEMPWITTEFSNDYYAVGCGLSSKYLRMHVDTEGLYKFEFENLHDDLSSDLTVVLYNANHETVDYSSQALEAGDYTVVLSNTYADLSIAKIRYVLIKTAENLETTITQ